MSKLWTYEETENAGLLVRSGRCIKDNMHLFPNRTYAAVLYKCQTLSGKAAPMIARIKQLMADGRARTASQIADAMNISRKRAEDYMRYAVSGPTCWAHVAGRVGRYHARVYKIGLDPAEDVDLGGSLTDEELDAAHRSPGNWWPCGDPVVINAMRAMCQVGSAA